MYESGLNLTMALRKSEAMTVTCCAVAIVVGFSGLYDKPTIAGRGARKDLAGS